MTCDLDTMQYLIYNNMCGVYSTVWLLSIHTQIKLCYNATHVQNKLLVWPPGFHPEKNFWGRSGHGSFTHRDPTSQLTIDMDLICVFGYHWVIAWFYLVLLNEKLDHIPSSCIVLMVHVVKGRQYTHWCRCLNRRDGV